MSEPRTIPEDALGGMTVALSVSDSADLHRLGLTDEHYEIAVAEVARAVFMAGGSIAYGGRIRPEGFTQVLLEEIHRYSENRHALTVYVPATEHRDITTAELEAIDKRLGTSARLLLLGPDGHHFEPDQRDSFPIADMDTLSPAAALTSMRQLVTNLSDARVVVGGNLVGFQGRMPGVIEEAILTVASGKPLYVAGGYGGASAAIAHALGYDDLSWAPGGFPLGSDATLVGQALAQLARVARSTPVDTGLNESDRSQLASTHRAGEMAALIALGLARTWSRSKRST